MISNQTQFEYEKEIKDKEGRYIIVKGRLENEPITLINIYAPPVKECRIGGADVSDHNPVFLKICLNNRTRHTVWRLNAGILNSEQRKERIKAEI